MLQVWRLSWLKLVGRPSHLEKEKKVGGTTRFGRTKSDVIGKVLDQASRKIND